MTTVTDSGTLTADQFVVNAGLYNQSAKLRRVFDAVMACGCDNVQDTIAHVERVRDELIAQSEKGSGYTPDKALGFGSESAAAIADSLLGRRASTGEVRKAFAKVGSSR